MPTILVSKVQRVENPYLWGAYLLKKAEKAGHQEKELFHATGQSNVTSIAANNYDWRRTVRSKFGKGVSFSPSAAYADQYCNMRVGTSRAMILNKVLVGLSLPGSQLTEVPTAGYDTTTGNSGKVYVKYGDNDFYPEYVAYYSNSTFGSRSGAYGGHYSGSNRLTHYYDDDDLYDFYSDIVPDYYSDSD